MPESNVGFTVDVTKLRAKVKRILAEIELRDLLSTCLLYTSRCV